MEITVVEKKAGSKPEAKKIENSLEKMQEMVGGYIEIVHAFSNVYLVCNEEGKNIGLEPNFAFNADVIVGNVLFAAVNNEGDFESLTTQQQELVMFYLTGEF